MIVAAKVNGVVKDLRHPIMDPNSSAPAEPVTVELIPANTPEGKEVSCWGQATAILCLSDIVGNGWMKLVCCLNRRSSCAEMPVV